MDDVRDALNALRPGSSMDVPQDGYGMASMADDGGQLSINELNAMTRVAYIRGVQSGHRSGFEEATAMVERSAARRVVEAETLGVLAGLHIAVSTLRRGLPGPDDESSGAVVVSLEDVLGTLQASFEEVSQDGAHGERADQRKESTGAWPEMQSWQASGSGDNVGPGRGPARPNINFNEVDG